MADIPFGGSMLPYCDPVALIDPPVVTVTQPTGDIILENRVVLSCDVRGDPQPTLEWSSPPGANAVVDSSSGELTIPTASPENSGTYTCTAINTLGSGADSATIIVRGTVSTNSC